MSLPSYRGLRKEISVLIEHVVKASQNDKTSALDGIKTFVQHEGHIARFISPDGGVDDLTYKEAASERIVTDEEIMSMKIEDLIQLSKDMGSEIGVQKAKETFQTIADATEKTGNVVDGKGQKMSVDMFFELVEKVQIDFEDDGQPRMPTLYVAESKAESIRELTAELEKPENVARQESIMKQKKEDWLERESYRKLVD